MSTPCYISRFPSPLGEISAASDGTNITGLWFVGQKYYMYGIKDYKKCNVQMPVFSLLKNWLDIYFSGQNPEFIPPLNPTGSDFAVRVWDILQHIPYGSTVTYGAIAAELSAKTGKRASPQAVGGAVGHNPISILIPCHRVVGSSGSLTGYAGGIDKKLFLLNLEGADTDKLFIP